MLAFLRSRTFGGRPRRRRSRASVLIVTVGLAAMSACGDAGHDGSGGGPSTSVSTTSIPITSSSTAPSSSIPTSISAPTTLPSSTLPSSTLPSSTLPATTLPPTTSTTVCPSIGDRGDERAGFPGSLSSLVGVDVRTGAHPCFERIVIEFAAGDAPTPAIVPGYWVRYTDGPITLGQTDDQFVELRGDADLLITVEAWMFDVDADGRPTTYAGPIDRFPTNVTTIREIRLIDNWEGVQVWAVGLDRVRDLRVTVLDDPVRLVIDLGA